MTGLLDDIRCARIPAHALAALADLRGSGAIRVTPDRDDAWVRWDAGDAGVLPRLLPVAGAVLFARRDGLWYRPGAHLPAFDVPADLDADSIPLARAVLPSPIRARRPASDPPAPARLGLARVPGFREATAIRCSLADLGRWAETATADSLAALRAAHAGGAVLIVGRRPPPIAGDRFWGGRVLSPLGQRPDPDLPEPALLRALGAARTDVVVLEADGYEIIPGDAFGPMSRAGVRLAAGGGEGSASGPRDGGPTP
jgi:MoxR-vWA-beta-propeller ternary system domain bpX2